MAAGAASAELSTDAGEEARDGQHPQGPSRGDFKCRGGHEEGTESAEDQAADEERAPEEVALLETEDPAGDAADASDAPVEHEDHG